MRLLYLSSLLLLLSTILPDSLAVAQNGPKRIVVVPFAHESQTALSRQDRAHYRRVMRTINNHLARSGFEVINAFAAGYNEAEYRRVMQRSYGDSAAAALALNQRFATDMSYLVGLRVRTQRLADGLCQARVHLDGEGYDSAGRDLGAGISDSLQVTRRSCDDAVIEAKTALADRVGRTLAPLRGDYAVVSANTISEALVSARRGDALPTIDIVINFEFDSARIRPSSDAQLRQLATALQMSELNHARISVEGHTDSVGRASYNCRLSRQRAASVKRALVERYGIASERLVTRGFGESRPVESNVNRIGRAFNRRVSFINLTDANHEWEVRRDAQACS